MLVNESGQLGCTSNSGNLRFRILTEELIDALKIYPLCNASRDTCLLGATRLADYNPSDYIPITANLENKT